jgi:hypothetical protein
MTTTVHRKNEISLFGDFYPIVGPVKPALASQFAQKQVIGDYTKDDELIASSWIISDQRGGIGIKDMEERGPDGLQKDTDRCWFSTANINDKNHRTLPRLVTDTTNPTGSDPLILIEFQNVMYCAFGTAVYTWTEGSSTWTTASHTLPANPTDAIVYKNKLYFCCTSDFERYDGTTWQTGTQLGAAQTCVLAVEWDQKLFLLDATGQLDYSTDEGVTWLTNALSTLPNDSFTALFTFDDPQGADAIYLGTKEGPFYLDYDTAAWKKVQINLPFHRFNCKGADAFRDAAYFPTGLQVIQYKAVPPTISVIGLDRDGGLPSEYTGSIVKILPGLNFLFAFVDATARTLRDLYPAGAYGDITIYDEEGFSAIFQWTPPTADSKGGWTVAHLGSVAATPLTTGVVATANDIYRLWFAIDGSVSFMALQETLQNPKAVAQFPFALTSEHISPWFDADNSVIDKLAIEQTAYYEDLAPEDQEYAMLYYGFDYDEDIWTLFTNDDFPDGKIDANGETTFTLADDEGVAFKAYRLRELLFRRSADNTKSPDCRWLRLKYIKLLTPKFAYTVQIDCSRNYRNQTSRALLAKLKTALTTQTLGTFTFKDRGASETHQCRIANMEGVEIGGRISDGLYNVQLVAP